MAGVDLGNAWGPAVWEDGVWAIPGAWASDGGGETLVLCSSVSSGQLLDEFVEVTDGNSYDASVSGQEVLSQSWTAGSDPTELVRACMRMRLRGSYWHLWYEQ